MINTLYFNCLEYFICTRFVLLPYMAILFYNIISCFDLSNMTSVKESDLDNIRAELLKNVGKNIQHIREQKGLSQFDLITRMLGEFDVTNVSRIESGRNNPTLFTLYRIAKALDVSLPVLIDFPKDK